MRSSLNRGVLLLGIASAVLFLLTTRIGVAQTPKALDEVVKRFHGKTPYALKQSIKKGDLADKSSDLNAALKALETVRGKVSFRFREARAGQWGYLDPKRTTVRVGVYVVLEASLASRKTSPKGGELRILQFGYYPGATAEKLEPIVAHLAGFTDHKGKTRWLEADAGSDATEQAMKQDAVGWFVDRNLHVGNARTKKTHVYPFYGMPAFNYRGNLQAWSSRLADEPWVAIVDAPSMPVSLAKEQAEMTLPFHAAVVELDSDKSSEYEKVGSVLAVLKWGFVVSRKGEARFLKPKVLKALPTEAKQALSRWNSLRTDSKRGSNAVDFPKSKSPNAVRTYPRKHFVTLKLAALPE